jgi:hypothetical protein
MQLVGSRQSGASATGCSPFMVLRPLTDGGLVLAKYRAATRATLTAWAIVLTVVVLWLGPTGKWRVLAAAPALQETSAFAVGAGSAAVVVGLVLLTWLQLIGNLSSGLTGRLWLMQAGAVTFGLSWMPAAGAAVWLWHHPAWRAELAAALPALTVAVVGLKLLLAVWLASALVRRGTVNPRRLTLAALAWAAVAAGYFGLIAWLVPPQWVSPWAVALGLALLLPLNRFAAAPLALALNRHR